VQLPGIKEREGWRERERKRNALYYSSKCSAGETPAIVKGLCSS